VNLRFDDRLATVLAQDDSLRRLRILKWQQTLDLLAQLGQPEQEPFLEAYAFLRRHHAEVPPEAVKAAAVSLKGHRLPPELDPFLSPARAAPALHLADAPRQHREAKPNGHAVPGLPGISLPPPSEAAGSRPIFFQTPAEARPRSGRSVSTTALDAARRSAAKAAFTTRRVPEAQMRTLVSGAVRPRTGDLVLARVDRILYQSRLELASGRKAALHVGDEIIVAYGDRYATDQFEAEVPSSLRATNLVATGGVAADMLSKAASVRRPTEITPIGLVGDAEGRPLNLGAYALERLAAPPPRPRTVAVLGTSMNSGKTTINRYLIAGLSRAGLKPGAAKITGTGSGGDFWVMEDAGAHRVLDFTDAGYSSTYHIPVPELEAVGTLLIDHLAAEGCGIILVEIADGLFHDQNAELIRSDFFRRNIDGAFFAAGEAMGAERGVAELRSVGVPVLGISGLLTSSELLMREAARFCDAPVLTKAQLCDQVLAPRLVGLPATGIQAPGDLSGGAALIQRSVAGARAAAQDL
jgi:hypothetical protein